MHEKQRVADTANARPDDGGREVHGKRLPGALFAVREERPEEKPGKAWWP